MTGSNNTLALASESSYSLEGVLEQLDAVIIGKQPQIRLALACLLARGHLLIEDMPGVGKTTLAHTLAITLGLPWNRIQFTSDLLPADITGVSVFNNRDNTFEFHPGPVFSAILLADEINRAPPKAQSALLEAMEERQISVDGETHALPNPFFVIATLNPADRLGAYGLPESQLDRFLAGISLGYPSAEAERELLSGGDRRQMIAELTPRCDVTSLMQWQDAAANVHVSDAILDYVQALLQATRNDSHVILTGLSPRAGLSLVALSRAWALLEGRDMVLHEDVSVVFPALASHRLTGSVRDGAKSAHSILDLIPVGKV